MSRGGAETETERSRERTSSRLHTVSTEPDTGLHLTNHEIKSLTLNRPSCPGSPKYQDFNYYWWVVAILKYAIEDRRNSSPHIGNWSDTDSWASVWSEAGWCHHWAILFLRDMSQSSHRTSTAHKYTLKPDITLSNYRQKQGTIWPTKYQTSPCAGYWAIAAFYHYFVYLKFLFKFQLVNIQFNISFKSRIECSSLTYNTQCSSQVPSLEPITHEPVPFNLWPTQKLDSFSVLTTFSVGICGNIKTNEFL